MVRSFSTKKGTQPSLGTVRKEQGWAAHTGPFRDAWTRLTPPASPQRQLSQALLCPPSSDSPGVCPVAGWWTPQAGRDGTVKPCSPRNPQEQQTPGTPLASSLRVSSPVSSVRTAERLSIKGEGDRTVVWVRRCWDPNERARETPAPTVWEQTPTGISPKPDILPAFTDQRFC